MTSDAEQGVNFVVEVDEGTDTTPDWVQIAGQSDATLNRSTGYEETTSKDSGGWKDGIHGIKEWSIEADSLLVLAGAGIDHLDTAWLNDNLVDVRVLDSAGDAWEGVAILTDWPIDAMPTEGPVEVSATFEGVGALTLASPASS